MFFVRNNKDARLERTFFGIFYFFIYTKRLRMSFKQEKSDAKCINGVPVVFEISFRYEDKIKYQSKQTDE